mmetsp:Transcript_31067/g.99356  ORF Transcript_31067/g.99356 Transcript_31067/m.99356 type:complete len:359 (+) Transcript_31067:251-1327(+)
MWYSNGRKPRECPPSSFAAPPHMTTCRFVIRLSMETTSSAWYRSASEPHSSAYLVSSGQRTSWQPSGKQAVDRIQQGITAQRAPASLAISITVLLASVHACSATTYDLGPRRERTASQSSVPSRKLRFWRGSSQASSLLPSDRKASTSASNAGRRLRSQQMTSRWGKRYARSRPTKPWPHARSAIVLHERPAWEHDVTTNASSTAYASIDSMSSLTRSAVGSARAHAANARPTSGLCGITIFETNAQSRCCSPALRSDTNTFGCRHDSRIGKRSSSLACHALDAAGSATETAAASTSALSSHLIACMAMVASCSRSASFWLSLNFRARRLPKTCWKPAERITGQLTRKWSVCEQTLQR